MTEQNIVKINTNTSERLKNLIARFVLKYNFWGFLFSRIRRKECPNLPSIMGVSPEPDGTISLLYRKELVDQTDDKNLLTVIEHEGLHILNKHIPRLLRILSNEIDESSKQYKMQIFNIASDCAVNEQGNIKNDLSIANQVWQVCLPEKFNLEPKQITEKYYLDLLEQNKDNEEKYKNGTCKLLGDHSKWGDISHIADISSLSRKVDQHIRSLIKESVKSFGKERGNLPSNISDLIQGALMIPQVPYYQIIRKLVRGSRFSKFVASPTKINRKRTYAFLINNDIPQISPFPGKKRDFTFDIVIVIDTSGSMSNDDIKEGLTGIKNIIENDRYCRTTVLEVDGQIQKEYNCKKIRDIQHNVKGRGGTTLGPGLFRAKELNCDICLAFSDGYTENINNYPRRSLPKKIIWVINKNGDVSNINKTGFVVKL